MSHALRILHLLRAPVGGLFRHVCDLAAEQAARGHQVGILYDASTGDKLTADRLAALEPVCALGLHSAKMSRDLSHRDVAGYLAARTLARNMRPDILHGHGAKGGAFARLTARALAAELDAPRAIYTPHGGTLHYDPATLKGFVLLGLERRLDRMTDGLVFESAYSARVYRDKVGAPAAPMRVIPNGLLPADFASHRPGPTAADFLFVGELRELKGVDVLLKALYAVNQQRPASAVIVGSGPDAAEFRQLAQDLGLGTRVRFLEPRPARAAFALGRSLVVPSRAESFPYIVLEAAAAGLPLIASEVGGIPEITGHCAALVPAGDDAALARAMLERLADPLSAAHSAAALRRSVAERFTIERMTDAILAFYAEALLRPLTVSAAA